MYKHRVTVLGLCVCVCVCVGTCLLQAMRQCMSDTINFICNKNGDFAKTTAFTVEKLVLLRITLRDPVNH